MKEVIRAVSVNYGIKPVFESLMMERNRYAQWRAKIETMSYRHDNQDKTPGLVSFQNDLTKRDLQ